MEITFANFRTKLTELYNSEREADAIIARYGEDKGELEPLAMERLLSGEPLQQVIGKGYFYGRDFKVTPATLIPRGETEELVQLAIKRLGRDFDGTIIDIGTGSGAIAITLSLELPKSQLKAIDFSGAAIEVARLNAEELKATVDFEVADIFELNELDYDVVISNPPYVTMSQRAEMHRNVVDFEPSTALFVEDDDPLIFYRTIAQKAVATGQCRMLMFEINELFGAQMRDMLIDLGYINIEIIKDIHDRDRVCYAELPNILSRLITQ